MDSGHDRHSFGALGFALKTDHADADPILVRNDDATTNAITAPSAYHGLHGRAVRDNEKDRGSRGSLMWRSSIESTKLTLFTQFSIAMKLAPFDESSN
jgi:hypothetical protein